MKTITMDYNTYQYELEQQYNAGLTEGARRQCNVHQPILQELLEATRLQQTESGITWMMPMSSCTDTYRRHLRELLIASNVAYDWYD